MNKIIKIGVVALSISTPLMTINCYSKLTTKNTRSSGKIKIEDLLPNKHEIQGWPIEDLAYINSSYNADK